MSIREFEDIIAWQKAREFINILFQEIKECHDSAFRNQIMRASYSVMNNIAEGFERGSKLDFRRFLNISRGSCGEVRSMLYLAFDLNYLSKEKTDLLIDKTREISRIIFSLSEKL